MARGKQKDSSSPIILMIVGSIIILAVVIWQTARVLDRTTAGTTPTGTDSGFIPYPDVQRVSLADAKAAFDAGTAVFLDVRDAQSFSEAHIAGAINIDYSEIELRFGELNRSDRIITYCT